MSHPQRPLHFLYPLNPKYGTLGIVGGKKILPASLGNFKISINNSWDTQMEWWLVKNTDLVEKGDFIWAYFTLPVSGIHAVGNVQKKWVESSYPGSPTVISIKWSEPLTKNLWKSPITFKELGYAPRSAAIHVRPEYQKILNTRLPKNEKPASI
jgi:hypothetical protein